MADGWAPSPDGGGSQAPADPEDGPDLRPGWRLEPHHERLAIDHPARDAILEAHRRAVERGELGYRDPATGLFAMTSVHLHDRGWCCDRGCRHCPYIGSPEGDPTARGER